MFEKHLGKFQIELMPIRHDPPELEEIGLRIISVSPLASGSNQIQRRARAIDRAEIARGIADFRQQTRQARNDVRQARSSGKRLSDEFEFGASRLEMYCDLIEGLSDSFEGALADKMYEGAILLYGKLSKYSAELIVMMELGDALYRGWRQPQHSAQGNKTKKENLEKRDAIIGKRVREKLKSNPNLSLNNVAIRLAKSDEGFGLSKRQITRIYKKLDTPEQMTNHSD